MSDPRRRRNRRRAIRRDILGSLALVAAIFVSILALPFGAVHESACMAASHLVGRPVPCGLSSLNITLSTDHRPFVSISLIPLPLKL